MNDELYELFERYLYDELDDVSTAELIKHLERPENRRELVEHVQWSAMITRGARQLAGRMASLRSTTAPAARPVPEPVRSPTLRHAFRYALAGVVSVAATLLVVLGLRHTDTPATPDATTHIAVLRLDTAEVHAMRDGLTFVARNGMPVLSGDLLEVTGGGVSSVRYSGENTFVRLQSGTQAAFSKQASGSKHIHLLRGRIAASVSPQPDVSPMEVTALHTKATVLGTRFALAVNEEGMRLGVENGRVRLTHPASGDTVVVEAGHSASCVPSGLAGPTLDVDFVSTLRGHWAFDDLGGTVAVDSSLSFCDARLEGCAWIKGQLGGALRFAAPDDCVEVESTRCGNFGSESFTISLWVRPETGVGNASLLCKGDAAQGGYELTFDQGASIFQFAVGDGDNVSVARSNRLQLPQNRWYHVMAVMDRDKSCLVLQLNGETVAKSSCNGLSGDMDSDEPVVMGADGSYSGALDDVRLFSCVLSSPEIANLQGKVAGYSAAPAGTTIFIE